MSRFSQALKKALGQPVNSNERVKAVGFNPTKEKIEWVEKCPSCTGENLVILTEKDRYGLAFPTAFCRECGLAFLHKRLTPAGYSEFYDGWYRKLVSAYSGRTIDEKTIQKSQETYSKRMAEFCRHFLHNSNLKTMFDIGGSTGVTAKIFQSEFGLKVTVLDPAPAETAEAERLGIENITCLFENFETQRKWDVATCFQTMDHLLDPVGCLRKIHGLLNENGLLIVDIVNFRAAAIVAKSLQHATKVDHPYSFTPTSFEPLLAKTGFNIVRTCSTREGRVPLYICRKSEPFHTDRSSEVDQLLWELSGRQAEFGS